MEKKKEKEDSSRETSSPQASNRLRLSPVSADNGAGVGNQNVRTITDAI